MLLFIIALTLITLILPYIEISSDDYSFSNVYEEQQKAIAGKLAHKEASKVGTCKAYWYQADGAYEKVWYTTYKAELAKRLISYELRTYSI